MRQYFRFLDDIDDPLFFYVEVDKHIITIKAFANIFIDGLPEDTSNLNIVDDLETSYSTCLKRHSTIIDGEHIQDVISGNLFNIVTTEDQWFKFFGAAQILRGVQNGVEFINMNTSFFDRNYGKNIGYNTLFFKEWSDCAMWTFDFNFEGMNWFYPKNLFYETINNKADFNRSEFYQSYVKAPMMIGMERENAMFSTGENRKRILGMFLFDKDDFFTTASFYSKVFTKFGIVMDIEGEQVPDNNWQYAYPIISNYNELPIPKCDIRINNFTTQTKTTDIHEISPNEMVTVDVTLYDDESYLLIENEDSKVRSNFFDSLIVLEKNTNQDLYFIPESNEFNSYIPVPQISDKYRVKKDIKMYIESDGGYLNKKEIYLKDGVGSFNFRALDLSNGDTVKIKIGFKAFSNISEITLKVVDVL